MKQIIIFLVPLFFTSCDVVGNMGTTGLILLFVILILLFAAMFFYVAKKRKQADQTVIKFSNDVKQMLDKLNDPNDKIHALEQLVERINNDEQYKKNTSWRDSVLSKVYQHQALVYYKLGDTDKIIESCSHIIQCEPSHMMSYYNRGSLYGNRGEYDKAIKDLSDAILLDPAYASAYNNRGLAYEKTGDYSKAIADFSHAIELDPTPVSYFNRANSYVEIQEFDQAKKDYSRAIELDPLDESQIRNNIDMAMEYINGRVSQ